MTSALTGHPSSRDPSSPFYDDPLYGHPWQTPEQREAKRRHRHAVWLSRLTEADWARICALAEQVTPSSCPARLDDLDAKGIAVGVCPPDEVRWISGERIGTVRDGEIAVVVWVK